MKVDSLWVKLFGVEDLKQGSYSDGSFFFHFSYSDIGFNVLSRSCANFCELLSVYKYTLLIFFKQPVYKQVSIVT